MRQQEIIPDRYASVKPAPPRQTEQPKIRAPSEIDSITMEIERLLLKEASVNKEEAERDELLLERYRDRYKYLLESVYIGEPYQNLPKVQNNSVAIIYPKLTEGLTFIETILSNPDEVQHFSK